MEAMKLVTEMYNKLREEVGFQCETAPIKQVDFEGFSIVVCRTIFDDQFGLIVLPNGKIVNDEGDDVYESIYTISCKLKEAIVYIESEGGTKHVFLEGTLGECIDLCKQNNYKWLDENEFEWKMYYVITEGSDGF